MNKKPDSHYKMKWIRVIEECKKYDSNIYYDYELGSECYICGVLEYENLICRFLSIEKKLRNNLNPYILRIKYPKINEVYNKEANNNGYCFEGDVIGEIISLLSVYYRCRFYWLATTTYLDSSNLPYRSERDILHKRINKKIHPPVFNEKNKNLAKGIILFFETIRKLDVKYHQRFILACSLYEQAIREIGINTEMVYIKLVSAIEVLSSQYIDLDTKDDMLKQKRIDELIRNSSLDKNERDELQNAFEVRKSGKKFIRFCEKYSKKYFKGGNFKAPQLKIKREDLCKYLKRIYKARSDYLHSGIPMYISRPMNEYYNWDLDATQGMIIDNKVIDESKKLPFAYFFEGLVRHCIIQFLEQKTKSQITSKK